MDERIEKSNDCLLDQRQIAHIHLDKLNRPSQPKRFWLICDFFIISFYRNDFLCGGPRDSLNVSASNLLYVYHTFKIFYT